MMGELLHIKPKLSFPKGRPFEVPDEFNGPERGTFYYRAVRDGALQGPFFTFGSAMGHMEEYDGIEPYQDSERQWWWSEPEGRGHGPFATFRDAEASIVTFLNT